MGAQREAVNKDTRAAVHRTWGDIGFPEPGSSFHSELPFMGCNLRNQPRSQRHSWGRGQGQPCLAWGSLAAQGTRTGVELPRDGVSGSVAPGSAGLERELHPLLPTHPVPWDEWIVRGEMGRAFREWGAVPSTAGAGFNLEVTARQ